MTVTLTSTTRIVNVNDISCRVWEGTTASGVPIQCMIARIAVDSLDPRVAEFEAELKEQKAPTAVSAFPLRLVL